MVRVSRLRSRQAVGILSGFFWLLLLAIFAGASVASADIVGRVPRVLILHPYDERVPADHIAGESARQRLIDATGGKIELFSEFLDSSRFRDAAHEDRLARYLSEKYADFTLGRAGGGAP